jgi:hypothetical protein
VHGLGLERGQDERADLAATHRLAATAELLEEETGRPRAAEVSAQARAATGAMARAVLAVVASLMTIGFKHWA